MTGIFALQRALAHALDPDKQYHRFFPGVDDAAHDTRLAAWLAVCLRPGKTLSDPRDLDGAFGYSAKSVRNVGRTQLGILVLTDRHVIHEPHVNPYVTSPRMRLFAQANHGGLLLAGAKKFEKGIRPIYTPVDAIECVVPIESSMLRLDCGEGQAWHLTIGQQAGRPKKDRLRGKDARDDAVAAIDAQRRARRASSRRSA